MSTVCLIGHPAAGHINPTLPVTAELVRRGERVVYYATEPFRAKVEKTGAEFRSYGSQDWFERNLAHGGMLGGMAGLLETAEMILPELLDQLRNLRPDYLLMEAHAVWGYLLVQILGLPAVTLSAMFAINEALISPRELIRHLYGSAPGPAVREGLIGLSRYFEIARRLHARYGAESPDMIGYLGNPQPLNIVFTSPEFQIGGGNAFDDRYKFVGPAIPSSCETFPIDLPTDRPLIYISMGTMFNDDADLYQACFSAFGDLGYTVILAAGHRVETHKLGQAPANFMVREYVPQIAVLEMADLFITHGGINSAHESLLASVPMIVLPAAADHYVIAGQVAAVGAGIVLNRREATSQSLRDLAARVLATPDFRRNARQAGESLRACGGAERAAGEVFKFKQRLGIER